MAFFTGAAVASGAPAGHDSWRTYTNVRFGYRLCYPATLLSPQREADNGDGRVFTARDGAELRVFGSNNAQEASLANEAKLQASVYLGRHGNVTYHRLTRDWDVTSGDDGRALGFYNKTFLRGDQFVAFQFKYPKLQTARYKPLIERLSHCFTLLQPAF